MLDIGSISLILTALGLLICMLPPVFNHLAAVYGSRLSAERLDKFATVSVRTSVDESIRSELRKRLSLVTIVALAGAVLSLYLFFTQRENEEISFLERPSFGEGVQVYKLWAEIDGKRTEISVAPEEKEPEAEEKRRFFDTLAEELFAHALNGQRADSVKEDLLLLDSLKGATVTWSISNMKHINSYGSIRGEIPEKGVPVSIFANISYGGYEQSYSLDICIYPKQIEKSEQDKLAEYIDRTVVVKEDRVYLPDRYEEKNVKYELKRSDAYKTISILALAVVFICWLSSEDGLDRQYKNWESELIMDYPKLLSRFSILLASGLSLAEGWKRMAVEYEEQLARGNKTSAGYEELLLSVKDMKNTGQVEKAIERFGIRCRERHYRQLSTLMIQSLNKGSVSLAAQLKSEAAGAFELRKENARVMGEKARAKLMLPSFLLFGITIALVIYPAWAGL